jgi:PAS domain S-box-containing protein
LILYPDISEAGKLQGGIGVELNFEKLREQIKSLLKERSNLVMLDDSLNIISADARNFVGANFNQMLNSLVDEPESVRFVSEELGKIEGMKSFTGRVYRNSRRTLIGFSAMPIRLNSSKIIIVDYHFLDEYMFLEFLPSQAVVWILLSGFGVIFGVVVVLYLNFRFSEMLEYEVERRTNELLKSEEKYRSIVENPFFGAYLMDITGFKYVNDKFCEIFGYTKDEILSLRDYSVLIHPDDRERLKEQLRRRLSGEIEINRWNARGLRKDGKVIFIEGFTKRVEFEGKPAAQGMIIDVTEEIKQREALQQAQKLESLGTLASGIAHDFNNILQIILGAGQLLGMKLKNTEFMRWVDTINTTAMRGAELAKRLLTFSRRKPVGDLKPVDLHHLIEDSVKIFKETFPRNIEIEAFLEAQNFVILAEESQVQQIIFNLAVNAKDAMPDGGKLIFRTENRIGNGFEAKPEVEYVVMHVTDTGVGMSDEVKRRIFEPFFTTKPPGKGTGLGLSTVYGLVKSYGGFIKVYSELGKGTKFSIYLPVYKETKVKEEKGEVKVKKTGTLLLIDDEEEIRMAGKEILEMEGFKVFVAGDGIEGINIYKEHKDEIDLVILDLNMPKMSGKETLAHLLLVNPEVKVIIATGYITEQEKEEIQGVAGYIEKPFDIVKLLQLISTLL